MFHREESKTGFFSTTGSDKKYIFRMVGPANFVSHFL